MMHEMLAQFQHGDWMPVQASSYASTVDWVFYFILAISAFFFALIVAILVLFIVKYRRRPGHREEKTAHTSLTLELTWTFIPTVLVVIIFVYGVWGFVEITTPPENTYDIWVTAQRWSWAFKYPNGYVDENLHIPADRPIRLTLASNDVIHSLFIPAFRVKKDVVPGRYNRMWFQADKVDTDEGYDLFCAEYCGTSHSTMTAKVYVHTPSDFNAWLERASDWQATRSPAEHGQYLYTARGCNQCHSTDGTMVIGPTFKNLWDHVVEGDVAFQDGSRLADQLGNNFTPEDYIRESIYDPEARIVAGFTPAMQSYQGQIKEEEIPAIIAFLRTLSEKHGGDAFVETDQAQSADEPAESSPQNESNDQTTTQPSSADSSAVPDAETSVNGENQ